jgi:lysophospholipase L1-like esterase
VGFLLTKVSKDVTLCFMIGEIMLECLILGDSLAVGVGQVRKECVTYAVSGINSYNYVNRHVLNTKGNTSAKTVIISLGSNDTKNIDTYEELIALRQLVDADRVYWILPNIKETKRKAVWMVARHFGDHILDARAVDRSPDTVHPTYKGYKELANLTK